MGIVADLAFREAEHAVLRLHTEHALGRGGVLTMRCKHLVVARLRPAHVPGPCVVSGPFIRETVPCLRTPPIIRAAYYSAFGPIPADPPYYSGWPINRESLYSGGGGV